jgi:hypothetical protein
MTNSTASASFAVMIPSRTRIGFRSRVRGSVFVLDAAVGLPFTALRTARLNFVSPVHLFRMPRPWRLRNRLSASFQPVTFGRTCRIAQSATGTGNGCYQMAAGLGVGRETSAEERVNGGIGTRMGEAL